MTDALDAWVASLDADAVAELLSLREDLWQPMPQTRAELSGRLRRPWSPSLAYGWMSALHLMTLRVVRETKPTVGSAMADEMLVCLEQLVARGLAYVTADGRVMTPVPAPTWAAVAHVPIDRVPAMPTATTAPPVDGAGMRIQAVTEDIGRVLARLEQQPPHDLSNGGVGVRDLRTIAKALDLVDTEVAFIVELAWAAGLIDTDGQRRWLPTKAYDTWLRSDTAGRWAALAEAWWSSARHLFRAGRKDDAGRPVGAVSNAYESLPIAAVRQRTLGAIADLPLGSVVDAAWVRAAATFLCPALGEPPGGIAEELFLEAEQLGLVVGGQPTSGLKALAQQQDLAETARALLPEAVDHVVFQNDGTAVVPGPPTAELAGVLTLVGDVESRGAATVVRISESTLRRAFDAGWEVEGLLAWFTSVARGELPQTLVYAINDLDRRYGRLRVGSAQSFVRCVDEATADEVVAHKALRELGVSKVAPTVLVSTSTPEALLKAMRSAGFAPAGDGAVAGSKAPRARARPRYERPRDVPKPETFTKTGKKIATGQWISTPKPMPWDVASFELPPIEGDELLDIARQHLRSGQHLALAWLDRGRERIDRVRILTVTEEALVVAAGGRTFYIDLDDVLEVGT